MMPNDVWIELYLWANGAKITYLEIAPFEGSYPLARPGVDQGESAER